MRKLTDTGKPQYWRLILVVGAAIGAIQGALLLGIPESPKYLVSVGNRNAARNSLARLRGTSRASNTAIEEEIRGPHFRPPAPPMHIS